MSSTSVIQMEQDNNSFNFPTTPNVTLPISARPECEGQATKPKLYLYRNMPQTPRLSSPLNDISKSTNSSSKSLGSFSGNSPAMTSFNISAVSPDYSRQSSIHGDNLLLNNNNVKSLDPGVDGVLETSSDPRLCPRVLVDVDLPIQRPAGSSSLTTATVVNNYLSARASPQITQHLDPGINTSSSKIADKKKTIREDKHFRNPKQVNIINSF
ncbi:hypothetical protein SNE40_023558 [Patella caerulea]|uniref:Uncharacterized protein n=1 Tax=Patella caerulea TaxID=87958 RepID=A0AAN8FVV3_PATCE